MSTTVRDLQLYKEQGRKFAMLTAYDFTTARILDEAGIPVLLVGDSLGMTMLGYGDTLPVTLDEMLHHTRAVRRGVTNAMVVGDMPFMTYHASLEDGIRGAGRFLKEGGANAVKLEGGGRVVELTGKLTQMGIPVMGHLGLTPQSVNQMGGFRVQGRTTDMADQILGDALALEQAGAFGIVLEGIPGELGARITEALRVPTIGIGAGPGCDAQVLVIQDLLGLTGGHVAKFVKQYADLRSTIGEAVARFAAEVESGVFPAVEHTYGAAATPSPTAGILAPPGTAHAANWVEIPAIYGGGESGEARR
ncbi:MAG: 3-methyl-2-oxobutanoate hydroxymethyltransferase [Candidatus Dormibacteria bacterium]